jgi:hypothetical protein
MLRCPVTPDLQHLIEGPLGIILLVELPITDPQCDEEIQIVLFGALERFERLLRILVITVQEITHSHQISGLATVGLRVEELGKLRDGQSEPLLVIIGPSHVKGDVRDPGV